MKRRKKRQYTWYLEPLTPETNRAIAAMLPEEDAIQNAICAGKTTHDVWRCQHSTVKRFLATAPEFGLKFVIFRKEGPHGPIRPWKFEKPQRQSRQHKTAI